MTYKTGSRKRRYKKPLEGSYRGIYGGDEWLIPSSYASDVFNMRFSGRGLKNRYGWQTISNGLTTSYNQAWSNVGYFVGSASTTAGKIACFQKCFFWDSDGTTEAFSGGRTAAPNLDLEGCFEFSGSFYVFSKEKMYSVNMSTGAATEQIDFSSHIGANYDSVVQMIPKNGQMWGVSDTNSRLFFSDTGVIENSSGSAITDEPLLSKTNVWQEVDYKGAISAVTVEALSSSSNLSPIIAGRDISPAAYIINGYDKFYVGSNVSVAATDVNILSPYTLGPRYSGTVDSVDDLNIDLFQDVSPGDTVVYIKNVTQTEEVQASMVSVGDKITLNDDNSSAEEHSVTSVFFASIGGTWCKGFNLADAVVGTFTTGQNAVVETEIQEVTMTAAANVTIDLPILYYFNQGQTWVELVLDTDYELSLNPYVDENADGHVRLLPSTTVKNIIGKSDDFRISYTESTTPWLTGNSGYINVGRGKGEIVEVVEAGAGLYIFKKNPGSIYFLSGDPGPNGTIGSLSMTLIHSGIAAEPRTIQATKAGIYFSSIDVDKVSTFFLPLISDEIREVPEITEVYNPPVRNLGNSSYIFNFRTHLLHNDMYAMEVTQQDSAGAAPNDDEANTENSVDAMYLCQAYFDNTWKGRWGRWAIDQREEMINSTKSIGGSTYAALYASGDLVFLSRPKTLGFYTMNGNDYRVYCKLNTDGTTYDFFIARYGELNGEESPVDDITLMAEVNTVNTDLNWSDGYRMKVNSGRVQIPGMDLVSFRKIYYGTTATDGTATIAFYKNFDTTAVLTKTVADLSNASGSENILRSHKLHFSCQYVKVDLMLEAVDAAGQENYFEFRDLMLEYQLRSSRGNVTEADN